MKTTLAQALDALKSCEVGGYVDCDGDYQETQHYDRELTDAAIAAIESALAAQDQLKPLPGADWTVTMREMQDRADQPESVSHSQQAYKLAKQLCDHLAVTPTTVNSWREAVLDQLAIHCIDCPTDTPPADVLKQVIDMATMMANDTVLNEPVAWLIELEDSQYAVTDIDDPQLVDDCTNADAMVVPLYTQQPTIPAGMVLVPENPTDAVLDAIEDFHQKTSWLKHPDVREYQGTANGDSEKHWSRDWFIALHKAMLKAAKEKA